MTVNRTRMMVGACVLATVSFAFSLAAPAGAADNGDVIVVEGGCSDGQHADLGGACVCNDSTQIVVDFECTADPGQLFGEFGDILVDACEFFGICGGGGGGGNPDPPEPDPEPDQEEEEDECAAVAAQCQSDFAECAAGAFEDSEGCAFGAALLRCGSGTGGMVFPGGGKPECRLTSKTGRIFCTFPDPLQDPPFVGEPADLFNRCIDDWIDSGELSGEVAECETAAITEMEQCQNDIVQACDCSFSPTGAALRASLPASDNRDPEPGIFLRTKVRTKGETAIDAEAFVRNSTRTTCYWHLTAEGTLPPEGTLYCKAGSEWDAVGASRFLMADGDRYLADGACGVATQDGVASGSATFLWKVERDESGALLDAKVKSVAGHIVGSLDGAHPYYGDCKVTGKAIEEREVPSGLLALVRER